MKKRLCLDAKRQIGTQNRRQYLPAGLDRSFGPAVLLRLEGVHLDGHFSWRDQVREKDELPPAQLSAIAQIQILGQRVVLPAAGIRNRRPSPDPCRAIEIEEETGPIAAAVLEHEVAVQQDRLNLGEERVVLVDVSPACLHHRHLGIGEELHGALQEVGGRDEIGVENRHELAARDLQSGLERAGLVASAVGPVDVGDVDARARVPPHGACRDTGRLVCRVVQDLNLEQVPRIVQLADRVDQPVGDVHLVVNRQLNSDARQLVEGSERFWLVSLVLHVQVHQVVPVPSIHGQNNQNEEIGRENQRLNRGHTTAPAGSTVS